MNEITKELLEALKRCRFDSLNMTLEDLEFCRKAIFRAEAALAELQADEDGWIPWSGGECPAGGSALVTIQTREGGELTAPARVLQWIPLGLPGDIIAYRIIKESDK